MLFPLTLFIVVRKSFQAEIYKSSSNQSRQCIFSLTRALFLLMQTFLLWGSLKIKSASFIWALPNFFLIPPPTLCYTGTCDTLSRPTLSISTWASPFWIRSAQTTMVKRLYLLPPIHLKWLREGVKKRFFLGLCPKLWVGGGPKSQTF